MMPSRPACAKLFHEIIQHAFERAFELVFELLPLAGDCFSNEPIHFGARHIIHVITARRSGTV
jgi:hypothetical protein